MTRAVEDVLEEIDAGSSPRMLVLNKADLLDDERRRELSFRHPDAALVSRGHRRGPGGAARADHRRVRDDAARRRAARAVLPGRPAVRAARRRGRDGARGHARGRPRQRPPPDGRRRALRPLRGQRPLRFLDRLRHVKLRVVASARAHRRCSRLAVACEPVDGLKTTRVARGPNTRHRVLRRRLPRHAVRRARPAARIDDDGADPHADRARAASSPIERGDAGTRVFLLYGDPDGARAGRAAWLEQRSSDDHATPSRPSRRSRPISTAAPRSTASTTAAATARHRTINRWRTRRYSYRDQRDARCRPRSGKRHRSAATTRGTAPATVLRLRATRTTSPRATAATPPARSTRAPDGRSMRRFAAPDRRAATASRSPAPGRSRPTGGGSARPTSATAAARRWSIARQRRPLRRRERRGARDRPLDRPRPRRTRARYLTMYHQICAGCTLARDARPRRRPRPARAVLSAGRRSRSRPRRGRRRRRAARRRRPARAPRTARAAAGRSGRPPRPRTARRRG